MEPRYGARMDGHDKGGGFVGFLSITFQSLLLWTADPFRECKARDRREAAKSEDEPRSWVEHQFMNLRSYEHGTKHRNRKKGMADLPPPILNNPTRTPGYDISTPTVTPRTPPRVSAGTPTHFWIDLEKAVASVCPPSPASTLGDSPRKKADAAELDEDGDGYGDEQGEEGSKKWAPYVDGGDVPPTPPVTPPTSSSSSVDGGFFDSDTESHEEGDMETATTTSACNSALVGPSCVGFVAQEKKGGRERKQQHQPWGFRSFQWPTEVYDAGGNIHTSRW